MAAVCDELCPIPTKRIKLDTMESSNIENNKVETNANTEKEETTTETQNSACQSPQSQSDADARTVWSSKDSNDDEDEYDSDNDDDDNASSSSSNASEISLLSEMSGHLWNSFPTALIIRAKLCGLDPRVLLSKIRGEGVSFSEDIPDSLIWRVIFSHLTEPPRRKRLPEINSLKDVIRLLKTCNKIMVLTGAGVSVSCGIPDFRSRDGVYARLAQDFPDLPDPQAMFDIHYFRQNPKPFFKFAKEIFPGQFTPSPGHRFIKLLEKHNKLLRNYTQNIDTLEKQAGIDNVIECHGSFATASCTKCSQTVPGEEIKGEIFEQKIPLCKICGEEGIMKPDIVFFGEGLPEKFHDSIVADNDVTDLLLVIGSSLKVKPVALIPGSLPANVPQVLINRERLPKFVFDVELLGDCDVILDQLCHMLGEGWEEVRWREEPLKDTTKLYKRSVNEFTDVNKDEEEEEIEDREVKCQRIGRRQGGLDACDEDVIRHTSLDSSRDSGIGESSNSSPLTQHVSESALPRLTELPEPNETSDSSDTIASCLDTEPSPQDEPIVPKDSYYKLKKRRYVFPGAELCNPYDSY